MIFKRLFKLSFGKTISFFLFSLLKIMSIEWLMPFSLLILCHSQSCPLSGYFSMSQLFASGGPSIGISASAPVLPVNIQGWFPLGLTALISLLSKGLLRVFSSTTTQKYPFFCALLSFWSNSHICTELLEKSLLSRNTISRADRYTMTAKCDQCLNRNKQRRPGECNEKAHKACLKKLQKPYIKREERLH